MRAIIIGGGIGGLAAAIALRRAGIDAPVFEAAPQLREIGAGITLWSNAVRGLARLGAADAVTRAATPIEFGEIRTRRGQLLMRTPVGRVGRDWGHPSICLSRAALAKALLGVAGESTVQLDARCVGFQEDASGVSAAFADGRVERGDVLIGADGLHSAVRQQLHGDDPPRYAGYACWRALLEFRGVPAGRAVEFWGPGARFGVIRLGAQMAYAFASVNTAPGGRDADPLDTLRAQFGDWSTPIPDVLAVLPREAILRHDIVDRPPLRRWGAGRVTLLGDAAHAMTPNLGQGACQSIEDAVELAIRLKDGADVPAALRAYERTRAGRAAWLVRESRHFGWIGQHGNPRLCAIRDAVIRCVPDALFERRFRTVLGR